MKPKYVFIDNSTHIDPKLVQAEQDRVELERQNLATKDRVDLSRKEYEETKAELARLRKIESKYNAIVDNLSAALYKYNRENVKHFIPNGEACIITPKFVLEKLQQEEPLINTVISPYSLITTLSIGYGFRLQELKGEE